VAFLTKPVSKIEYPTDHQIGGSGETDKETSCAGAYRLQVGNVHSDRLPAHVPSF
jgi:hypothetical protein